MSEVVKHEGGALAPADEPRSILAVIAQAASDPRVDVPKMQALLEMQRDLEQRAAKVEFDAAFARLSLKLPRIQKHGVIFNKDGVTVRSKFATYEDIDAVCRPLLAEEGFAMSFRTEDPAPRSLRVIGTLSHRMGYSRESSITLPVESMVISGAQLVGSIASFGKRYVYINMLNIITIGEDNDGRGELKVITDDQALTLETMMVDVKADPKKFLEWLGVPSLRELPVASFPKAIKALEAKARKQ